MTSVQNSLAEKRSRMTQEPPTESTAPGARMPPVEWYIGRHWYMRSVSRASIVAEKPCTIRSSLEWVILAAFGRPVVPEV